jgi:hypothetical protein
MEVTKSLDALKIYYIVVLGSDDPYDVTPFQGFSRSWRSVHWSLAQLALLPSDILERSSHFPQIIAQRMGGHRSLLWTPLNIRALESLAVDELGVFVVVFTGEQTAPSGCPAGGGRSRGPFYTYRRWRLKERWTARRSMSMPFMPTVSPHSMLVPGVFR